MNFFEKLHNAGCTPLVMGILNVTPDSFSDGGQFETLDAVRDQVGKMVAAGVDIIDVGGESTRPGAASVDLQQELDRVLPVVSLIRQEFDVAISVDTYKTEVMREALKFDIDLINDVNALQASGALELVSQSDVCVCLMHKLGKPETMQDNPFYENVVGEVKRFLISRIQACEKAGVATDKIIVDPGFGFGKTLNHNVELFLQLEELISVGYPVLTGVSRKRMIGELLDGLATEERVVGSVTAAVLSAQKGVKILRVHDVPETIQAIKIYKALYK